jgi:glycosyltransferase involved in cell wall biosynthesis
MTKTFTVIIPAYNASQYLSETIDSVLAQTFDDFELLIIDDGSTDNTAEIANHYCQLDNRVKLISQSNKGVASARNQGIKLANSKFIALLDADDLWLPNKLFSHFEHLHHNSQVGVSFAKVEFLTSNGELTGYLSNSPLNGIKPAYLLYENPTITPSNFILRREVFEQVGNFEEQMRSLEDLELLLRVACNGIWKIEGINQVLTQYRISKSSLSSDLYKMEESWNLLIDKVTNYAPNLVNQHYYKAKSTFLRYLARRTIRCNFPAKVGLSFMNRALKSDWKIILREPRRTVLTMAAVYGKSLISNWNTAHQ